MHESLWSWGKALSLQTKSLTAEEIMYFYLLKKMVRRTGWEKREFSGQRRMDIHQPVEYKII